jgi:ABC-2 type transport system permease protein
MPPIVIICLSPVRQPIQQATEGEVEIMFSPRSFVLIFRKELHEMFSSLMAYVVIAIFLAAVSYTFTSILFFQRSVTVIHALAQAANLMLLLVPVITMRQFSKEQETGTFELLMSTSVSELEIVLAKYCACLILIFSMVILTLSFPLSLAILGSPDYGAIVSGYLGLFLLSAAFAAISLCVAAFIANPIVAAIVSFGLLLALWMIEVANYILPAAWQHLVDMLSFDIHYSRFLAGAVYLSDCTFFLLIIISALLICVQRGVYR